MQLIPLLLFLSLSSCLPLSLPAPIKVTFEGCANAADVGTDRHCCPEEPKRPITDFKPVYNSSKPLRIRKALQCLEGEELAVYQQKVQKAYELVRALPHDDPRSYYQQDQFHCAHASGSLHNDGATLNVHFGWLFLPWHRWYSYFHERILQSLLDDPTFTLHFWNWDNDGVPIEGYKGCSKAGHRFPALYGDPSSPLFHPNRSPRALNLSLIVDLGISSRTGSNLTDMDEFPESVVLARNAEVLHKSLVTIPTNTDLLFGRRYRAGDHMLPNLFSGMGSLEWNGHSTVHFWINGDMGATKAAAKDPIFHAHHWNVDRLWNLWHSLGPGRVDPVDPDFLDAEFLFYDEHANLRRVKLADGLDHRVLGYDYEEVNDASWNHPTDTSNSYDSAISNPSATLLASKARAT